MRISRSKNKGFTLIELMVVISIIGLLSSVVLASTKTVRAKARDAQRIQAVHQMDLAIKMFANDNNGTVPKFASCGNDILPCTAMSGDTTGEIMKNNWTSLANTLVPKYIPSLPSSLNDIDYVYIGPTDDGDQTAYQVSTTLETISGSGSQIGYSSTGSLIDINNITPLVLDFLNGAVIDLNFNPPTLRFEWSSSDSIVSIKIELFDKASNNLVFSTNIPNDIDSDGFGSISDLNTNSNVTSSNEYYLKITGTTIDGQSIEAYTDQVDLMIN